MEKRRYYYYTHTCILTQMVAYVHVCIAAYIHIRTLNIYLYIYTKLSMCDVQRIRGVERPVLAALNVDVVR